MGDTAEPHINPNDIPLVCTVGMDAKLAQVVGIPAAMLYNLLLLTAQSEIAQDYDSEGWFYLTAEKFEERTTFNQNTFTSACKKLEEIDLIERKRMFVKFGYGNSNRSVMHFRIKHGFSDFQITRGVSATHTRCDLYNIENKKEKKPEITPKRDLPVCTKNSKLTSKEESIQPFDVPAKPVSPTSLRPDKADGNARKRAYACANELRKRLGLKGNASGAFKQAVERWLDAGYAVDDMVEAITLMKEDGSDYFKSANPLSLLAQANMDWYEEHKPKKQRICGDLSPGDEGYDELIPMGLPKGFKW